jgi:hypothetical protein
MLGEELPLAPQMGIHPPYNRHCRHPATTIAIQPPLSSSSHHHHRPATIVIVQLPLLSSIVELAMWTGEDARDTLSRVPDLHGIEGYNPSMVDVSGCHILHASLFPSGSTGPLTFHLLQASVHRRQGCSYQPGIFLTLASPSSH